MSTQTIQTRTITEQDIARGVATARRLRALAFKTTFTGLFAALWKPIGALVTGAKTATPHGAHPAAV